MTQGGTKYTPSDGRTCTKMSGWNPSYFRLRIRRRYPKLNRCAAKLKGVVVEQRELAPATTLRTILINVVITINRITVCRLIGSNANPPKNAVWHLYSIIKEVPGKPYLPARRFSVVQLVVSRYLNAYAVITLPPFSAIRTIIIILILVAPLAFNHMPPSSMCRLAMYTVNNSSSRAAPPLKKKNHFIEYYENNLYI